ncbi:MAG: hypothetical protein KJ077_05610 [Anaerolineae bacterium]|nr:hypothetical protein [Anaerolineae bacterium]
MSCLAKYGVSLQRGSVFLWIFIALFLLLGLGYSSLTPVFENSDETLHYPYVKHLADGQGLPLAVPGQLWNQEGTQPPLYYAIVAASTFWIDSDNLPELLQRNPHWLFTEVRALINDNQNLVLHGPMDAFPYQRAALAVHISRWWSLLFGLLAVGGTFLLARHLFPQNLPLILTATALTAFNPQFIRVSATVSNDSLSAALTTWAVLAAFKFTEPVMKTAGEQRGGGAGEISPLLPCSPAPRHGFSAPLLLGLLTGLAILTKLSSLTTLFLVAFIIFWRLFFLSEVHQEPLQLTIRWLVIIGGVTLVLTGWWFWRNYTLYGEWFATDTHLNLAGRSNLSLAQVWDLRAEAERAYWATFGWGQLRPPEWIFRLLFGFTRLGLIGLLLALAARLIQGDRPRPLPLHLSDISLEKIIPLLLWAAFNLALYLRWVMEVGSVSHTRLVFPAIAAISLLLALGWHALLPRRLSGWFSAGVITALLALNIYSLGWLVYPAFRTGEPVNRQANGALDLTFLNALKLVAGGVSASKGNTAKSGDVVLVSVQWQSMAPLDKNYSAAAVLLAPDGSVLARRETYPGLGLRPTRYLQPGDTFTDVYPLKLEQEISEPLVARATVNLFDFDSPTRAGFPALDALGQEVTPVVGQIKIVPKTWPRYQPAQLTQVNFADTIALIGYDFIPPAEGEGQPAVRLYWQSLAPVSDDYVVFLHLLDANGVTIGQADGPPANNAYPTRWWSPSELIADVHFLPPAPGAVALRLGLYDLASGQRLPIGESTLPLQDNSVEIALP